MRDLRPAVAPLILLGLTACDALDPPPPQSHKVPDPVANGPVSVDRPLGPDEINTPAGIRILPAEKRALVLAGHAAAGVALYRTGETEAAATHFDRLIADETASERAGFDAYGFDPADFESLVTSVPTDEEGLPDLSAAEEHIRTMLASTGTAPLDQVLFLMDQCSDSYAAGVMDSAIRRPLAYQTSYGYAVIARDIARQIEGGDDLLLELELLVRMWPDEGPVDAGAVAPEPAIGTQIARARLAASIL